MFGTLAGALVGRKIGFAREDLTATVEGRINGVGRTIRITAIRMHYEFAVAAEHRDTAERVLRLHPQGCPAHESVKDAIAMSWEARLRVGDEVIALSSEDNASG